MNIITEKNDFDKSIFESCSKFFKRFDIAKTLRRCGAFKRAGILVSTVFLFLLGQVFTGKKFGVLIKHCNNQIPFEKDVVYRFIDSGNVNWERIVFLTSNEVIPEIKKLTSDERRNALIIDDTTQYRDRSKKVEMLAWCHDHAENKSYKGHAILAMTWTDGDTTIPVDYRALSASDDKKLIHGSNLKEDNRTLATKRRKDARAGKPALVLEMLRNVKGTNSDADYVMFDSWFSSPALINQICKMDYDVIARLKNNDWKYCYGGEMLTLKQIYAKNRKRCGRAKWLLSVDITIEHKDHGSVPARLVFVRNRDKRSEWIAFICTDLSLSEEDIIAMYGKRWNIEVFFKVCKSILKLGKEFQCRSFDSSCALVSVVFLRYMKLAVENRENRDERSLGELFMHYCKEVEDISFEYSFAIILEAFANYVQDYCGIKNCQIDNEIVKFIAFLPCDIRERAGFLRCES